MALPTKAGRYIAIPHQWSVGEFNNQPTFDVVFTLTQHFNGAEWEGVDGDTTITKKFFLMKNDGTWSKVIESLVKALGWDGGSLRSLAESDWSATEVQLTIEYETKNDKRYIGVKFINERNWQGQSLSSDPAVVQSMEAKYGALLRQKTGAKATGRPAAKQTPAQKVLAPTTPEEARRLAWNEFKGKTADLSDDARKTAWQETVKSYANGKDQKTMTINDWENVANQIAEFGPAREPVTAGDVPPDDETPPIANDDIPF